MKWLLPIFVMTFVSSLCSQEKPMAQKVGEMTKPNCEVLSLEVDVVVNELVRDPNSTALIFITGKRADLRNDLFFKDMIENGFKFKQVPSQRWRVVKTGLGEEIAAQFWVVPSGADRPPNVQEDWSYELPLNTKPFVFAWGESYAENVCWSVNQLALLHDVLLSNPSAATNVVLRVKSIREYRERRKMTLRSLIQDFAIPRQRIRIYMVRRSRNDKVGIEPDAEYWLVPARPNHRRN